MKTAVILTILVIWVVCVAVEAKGKYSIRLIEYIIVL